MPDKEPKPNAEPRDSDQAEEKPTLLLSSIPYLLILFSTLITGLLFVVMNGPLLIDCIHDAPAQDAKTHSTVNQSPTSQGAVATNRKDKTFSDLITEIMDRYKTLAELPAKNFILGLMILLPVGYAVQQFYVTVAYLWVMIATPVRLRFYHLRKWLLRKYPWIGWLLGKCGLPTEKLEKSPPELFSHRCFMDRPQKIRNDWPSKGLAVKSEWEWEFFNFCIYWSIFTNCLVFCVLVWVILRRPPPVPLLILLGLQLAHAHYRSCIMHQVHKECLEATGAPQERKNCKTEKIFSASKKSWMGKDERCLGRPKMWRFVYFSMGWAAVALVTFLMLWTEGDGSLPRLGAIYWVGLAPSPVPSRTRMVIGLPIL
jgi:hypothetical protein